MTTPLEKALQCNCCTNDAKVKDYRGDQSFYVCPKHFTMDDRNFFKALKKKGRSA